MSRNSQKNPRLITMLLTGICAIGCFANILAYAIQNSLYGGFQFASGVAISSIFFSSVYPGTSSAKRWGATGSLILILCATFMLWQNQYQHVTPESRNQTVLLTEHLLFTISILVFGVAVGLWWRPDVEKKDEEYGTGVE